MALPLTADFTGTDNTALPTADARFSAVRGAQKILANRVASDTTTDETCCRVNSETFSSDQYSEITLSLLTNSLYIGPAVRCQTGAVTYYLVYSSLDNAYFAKMVANTYTDLVTPNGAGFVAGEVLRLEASGTTITVKRNGVQHSTWSVTDASISGGAGGISGWGLSFSGDTAGDNLQTGDLGGGGVVLRERSVPRGVHRGILRGAA